MDISPDLSLFRNVLNKFSDDKLESIKVHNSFIDKLFGNDPKIEEILKDASKSLNESKSSKESDNHQVPSDDDSGLGDYERSPEATHDISFKKSKAQELIELGQAQLRKHNFEQALEYFEKAKRENLSDQEREYINDFYFEHAEYLRKGKGSTSDDTKNRIIQAIQLFEEIFKITKDKIRFAKSALEIGKIYFYQNKNYDTALEYFNLAEKVSKKIKLDLDVKQMQESCSTKNSTLTSLVRDQNKKFNQGDSVQKKIKLFNALADKLLKETVDDNEKSKESLIAESVVNSDNLTKENNLKAREYLEMGEAKCKGKYYEQAVKYLQKSIELGLKEKEKERANELLVSSHLELAYIVIKDKTIKKYGDTQNKLPPTIKGLEECLRRTKDKTIFTSTCYLLADVYKLQDGIEEIFITSLFFIAKRFQSDINLNEEKYAESKAKIQQYPKLKLYNSLADKLLGKSEELSIPQKVTNAIDDPFADDVPAGSFELDDPFKDVGENSDNVSQKSDDDFFATLGYTVDPFVGIGDLATYEDSIKQLKNKEYQNSINTLIDIINCRLDWKEVISYANTVYSLFIKGHDKQFKEFIQKLISILNYFISKREGSEQKQITEQIIFLNPFLESDKQKQSALLSFLIESGVSFPSLFYNKGFLLFQENKYKEALQNFSEAIKLNPVDPSYYNMRGRAYFELGDNGKAILDYSQAVSLDAEFIEAYLNRGVSFSLERNYEKALSDFLEYERRNPNDPVLYFERANIKTEKEDTYGAIQDLEQYLKLRPNDLDAMYRKALLHFGSEEYGKVSELCDAVLNLQPDFEMAKELRGLVRVKSGDLMGAIHDFGY